MGLAEWLSETSSLGVPRGYALVLIVVIHNWAVLFWQALQVGKARRQFDVKYPTLYEQKDDSQFNCVQVRIQQFSGLFRLFHPSIYLLTTRRCIILTSTRLCVLCCAVLCLVSTRERTRTVSSGTRGSLYFF